MKTFGIQVVVSMILAFVVAAAFFGEASAQKLPSQVSEAFSIEEGELVVPEVFQRVDGTIAVVMTFAENQYELELSPHSVRSEDYEMVVHLPDGSTKIQNASATRTVRGSIRGQNGKFVGSVLDSGLVGKISIENRGVFYVEPVSRKLPGDEFADQHLVYKEDEFDFSDFVCGAKLADRLQKPPAEGNEPDIAFGNSGAFSIAEILTVADFDFFQEFGSVSNAVDQIEMLINIVNDQYESEVGIMHSIGQQIIWTNPNDPFTTNDPVDLLGQLDNFYTGNSAALVHLFTGRELAGTTVGIAFVGVTCNNQANFGLSQIMSGGFLAFQTDLVAHELGHNWNAVHCDCPNNTMNPNLTGANTFSGPTRNDIIAFRNSVDCLDLPGIKNWIIGPPGAQFPFNVGPAWAGGIPGPNDTAQFLPGTANVLFNDSTGNVTNYSALFAGGNSLLNGSDADLSYSLLDDCTVLMLLLNPNSNLNVVNLDVENELDIQGFFLAGGGIVECGVADIDGQLILAGNAQLVPERDAVWIGVDSGAIVALDEQAEINDPFTTRLGAVSGSADVRMAGSSQLNVGSDLRIGDVSGRSGFLTASEFAAVSVIGNVDFGDSFGSLGGLVRLSDNSSLFVGGNLNMGLIGEAELDVQGGSVDVMDTITNFDNGVINLDLEATGNLQGFSAALVINRGNVFTGGTTMTIQADLANSGTWEIGDSIEAGSFCRITGDVNNSGNFIVGANNRLIFDGDVSGLGQYDGPGAVGFFGDFNPGFGSGVGEIGAIDIEGLMFFGANNGVPGSLNIELAGTNDFDQVITGGGWDLVPLPNESAPMLFVSTIGGFEPNVGSQFTIVENSGALGVGNFAGLPEGEVVLSTGTVDLVIRYNAGDGNDILLVAEQGKSVLKGDVNLDGIVNLLDVDPFVDLLTTGEFQAEADIDCNGDVNLLDVDPFVSLLSGN